MKMNALFTYLFNEDVLKKLREKWIKLYDYNFIDNEIIGGLLKTKKNLSDLLSFIYNKATSLNVLVESKESKESKETPGPSQTERGLSSSGQKETKEEKIVKIFKSKSAQKITIPVPFNLSENKPRVLQEPQSISNQVKFIPVPVANYQKTSLKEIIEKRRINRQLLKKKILERNKREKSFDLKAVKRPSNLEKVRLELENKVQSTLQFDNKYITPKLDYSKYSADIKYNEAAVIKEEYLITKKNKKEAEELNKILIEKKDSKEFDRWQKEMKIKDNILKMQEIEKRKLELDLNREVASTYMLRRIQKNRIKAIEHKKQEILNIKKKAEEKADYIRCKKEVIKEIHKGQENSLRQKIQRIQSNRELYKNIKSDIYELSVIAKEEKQIFLDRRDDLIKQIRELEKLPIRRTTGFDPTETPGYGLLEEMSLVELRERLALQKRMLIDEIQSKKEENKLKMKERADEIVIKAQTIQENRDKLRNQKEIERKAKKDEKLAEMERLRIAREKSLFEVKQKIEKKKQRLKKEDEIFQKKVREIKLQRQFMQLGRDAVEFKQFKKIEEGVEEKINDRQNQDLIDQLHLEKAKWVGVRSRFAEALQFNKYTKDLINNYNNAYALSSRLNKMINYEDRTYKKAVYDRERALNKYLQEDIKEKNKFCFMMQQKTMKKKLKKNKSAFLIGKTFNNSKIDKKVVLTNVNDFNTIENNKEEEKGKESLNDDNEEQNPIQEKMLNEEMLSQNQSIQ